jgi:hypothetical protein
MQVNALLATAQYMMGCKNFIICSRDGKCAMFNQKMCAFQRGYNTLSMS